MAETLGVLGIVGVVFGLFVLIVFLFRRAVDEELDDPPDAEDMADYWDREPWGDQ